MTSARDAVRGFYAVLDRDDEALARALVGPGGARVLQLRIKSREGSAAAARELLRIGAMARSVCREHGAALVVNDRLDVALALEADGVHLGQTDLPIADARRIAGDRLWIGVSTHDLDQVRAACAGGADYLGYGPVFATSTKAHPDPVQGLEALRAAVRVAGHTPIVAIGGITLGDAAAVAATGVAAICAISAVLTSSDPVAAARAFGQLG